MRSLYVYYSHCNFGVSNFFIYPYVVERYRADEISNISSFLSNMSYCIFCYLLGRKSRGKKIGRFLEIVMIKRVARLVQLVC